MPTTAARIVPRRASFMEAAMTAEPRDLWRERRRKHLTLADVGNAGGIDPVTYHNIERGDLTASDALLVALEAIIARLPARASWWSRAGVVAKIFGRGRR